MLFKRVVTAVILLPLLLWALFALPLTGIAILIGAVVTVATWELTVLIGLKALPGRILYTLFVVIVGAAGSVWLMRQGSLLPLFAVATAWWIYAVIYVATTGKDFGGIFNNVFGRMTIGVLIMVPMWLGFLALYNDDSSAPNLLLYVLVLVWVADTVAYFSGKAWGRNKLAPAISPGKSIEGVVGGLVAVTLVAATVGHYLWHYAGLSLLMWIVLSSLVGAISVVGDLVESVLKRRVGAKESGTLLPGHGGLFDRIDALTAAVPVFAFGWQITNGAAW